AAASAVPTRRACARRSVSRRRRPSACPSPIARSSSGRSRRPWPPRSGAAEPMLFNSYVFLFAFLPLTLLAVWVARRQGARVVQAVLVLASLVFYGWFVPGYVLLLLGSVLVNYAIGLVVERRRDRRALALGVALNLGALGICKYLDFLIGTANSVLATDWPFAHIVLPLAISFFTFQQIAYLVDLHRGSASSP